MPVDAMSVERGRQNASWEERTTYLTRRPQYRQGGCPYTIRRPYCVSGSCSCASFVNSPMVELAVVLVSVTPRNSFLNDCPGVTYTFGRQVFNGLELICAALSRSGRAWQGRRDMPRVMWEKTRGEGEERVA